MARKKPAPMVVLRNTPVAKPVIGNVYRVTHERFGECVGRLVSIVDGWFCVEIVEGQLVGLCDSWSKGSWSKGERKTLAPNRTAFFE
jgi:hypothetical protein